MSSNILTLKIPHKTDLEKVNDLFLEQSKVYRMSYKLVVDGLNEKNIREHLKTRKISAICDSWFIQSAIKTAIGQVKAEKAKGIDVSSRIFGGKKNFLRRCKGLITKEEWREKRIENIRSIGESPQRGNRKFKFNLTSITFKPNRKTEIIIDLPELRGKWKKYYRSIVEMTDKKKLPITVELNRDFIFITFDKTKLDIDKVKTFETGRYLGIDINPNWIGVSFFNHKKELLDTKLISLSKLTGKNVNHNKLKHETREIANWIGKLAQHYKIEWLFVEDLSFGQGDKGKGKRFNRLCGNQFLHKEFVRVLEKWGKLKKVNAAYSSTIGNVLNDEWPDPIAASMEIARRGIESRIKRGSKKFYPPMLTKDELQNRWKEDVVLDCKTWIELHNWLKQTGVKYRVPIPDIGMFRSFKSKKSCILLY